MCGICGVTGSQAHHPALDQLATLRHRGPDTSGVYVADGAVLGQARLAVIDLLTGDPPITNEDGSVGVTFNGEIYNFRSLRDALQRDGHQFKTTGDAEVIAHLAENEEPLEVARRLDGMFAFAVWDKHRSRLVLGRDRLGKKPLYYWVGPRGEVTFGSEIKAVLADPRVPRRLDERAVPAYLTFGYVPTPYTFFEGIRSLPPASVVTFDADGRETLVQYWQPQAPGAPGVDRVALDYADAAHEVRRLLAAAVERRLVSDVPLGAFLSGGIDSSAVVALMARMTDRPVLTFTIGFDDPEGFDERPYARLLAEQYRTEHTEFVVDPDATELVERLVWHYDQPFGDSSALPTFLLAELTRRHVTVALTGDGGDELFAGYERFAAAIAIERLRRLPRLVRSVLRKSSARIPARALHGRGASVRRLLDRTEQDPLHAYLAWISYVPDQWRDALLDAASSWAVQDYERIWAESEGADLVDRLALLNLRTYLLDDLLPKVDRASMAHGLEVRSPFLDTALVEFALRLPCAFRLRGLRLKRVLKTAMAEALPRELLQRPKHGFGLPLDRWFRTDLAPWVREMLCSPAARIREHLRHDAVRDIVAAHQRGGASHGHALWTLLTLEVFLRREGW